MDEALDSLVGLSTIYRAYDGAERLLVGQIGRPICVRCGKCCRQNTPIAYGVEAANAVSHLIGQGRLYQLQRRIEGWLLDRHQQCSTYAPARLDRVSNGLDHHLQEEVLALCHTQCPFYEDGCIVYSCRPLVCRSFGVTRTAHGCPRPRGQGESESVQLVVGEEARAELRADVDMVLERVPRPTWKHAGLFPTLIYAHAWPNAFQNLVANGMVAQAKLVMTYPSMAVIFEEDVKRISLTPLDLFREDQRELARR